MRCAAPSICTVQAPHRPAPQPNLVPTSAEFVAQHPEQAACRPAHRPRAPRRLCSTGRPFVVPPPFYIVGDNIACSLKRAISLIELNAFFVDWWLGGACEPSRHRFEMGVYFRDHRRRGIRTCFMLLPSPSPWPWRHRFWPRKPTRPIASRSSCRTSSSRRRRSRSNMVVPMCFTSPTKRAVVIISSRGTFSPPPTCAGTDRGAVVEGRGRTRRRRSGRHPFRRTRGGAVRGALLAFHAQHFRDEGRNHRPVKEGLMRYWSILVPAGLLIDPAGADAAPPDAPGRLSNSAAPARRRSPRASSPFARS